MKTPPRPRARRTRKLNPSTKAAAIGTLVSKPLKSIYNKLFPIGYEDKKGFHYEKRK
jgi:hypothetical protein